MLTLHIPAAGFSGNDGSEELSRIIEGASESRRIVRLTVLRFASIKTDCSPNPRLFTVDF